MTLTKQDKVWLTKLAGVMMNHIVWAVRMGERAQDDWNGVAAQSFKEKVRDLLK